MEGTTSELKVRRQRIIERPRLLRLLEESGARVKMLVAPAGYGKTTLARQWLATKQGCVLSIAATPAVADGAVLFGEFCRALGRALPGRDERLRQRLAVTADPEAEWQVLLEILTEDLESLGPDTQLVVDDYHAIVPSAVGESIVGELARAGVCDVLIVGRSRPSWVSARQILYGDVLEIGQSALAMTSEEADSAFADDAPLSPGLVHLAQGWPAVLALAAKVPESSFPETGDALPETLHAFFAEELYESLDPSVQRGLMRVALAEVEDLETAREFFDDLDTALEQAAAVGWISDPNGDTIDLHPLLRGFLRRKLERDAPEEFRAASEATATLLIEHERWDEAARLISDQRLYPLLVPLLEASLESLLSQGRLATLREWTSTCDGNGLDAPVVRIAQAELAFRSGRFHEAEVLAASVSELKPSPKFAFAALELAGRAANIASRELEALEYFRAARTFARSRNEMDVAALGELGAASELELPEADELFDKLSREQHPTVPQQVLLVARRLVLDSRSGRPPLLNDARRAFQLLPSVQDPSIRASFRNGFAYGLAQAGASEEAAFVLAEQRREAVEYRLTFVAPHADVIEAIIMTLRGDFDRADVFLGQAERAGRASGDWFVLANSSSVRGRLLIGRGAFTDAINITLQDLGPVPASTASEMLATHALALACVGRSEDALAAADAAVGSSRNVETAVLHASTQAVVAVKESRPTAFEAAQEALKLANRLSTIEAFVAALRGCPELGALLMTVLKTRRELFPILVTSNETHRYVEFGEPPSGGWHNLSPREQQVLQLVAQGMSNPQIAKALFITPATVKVHVHSVLKKLGVSSRTAAALRVPPDARITRLPLAGGVEAGLR